MITNVSRRDFMKSAAFGGAGLAALGMFGITGPLQETAWGAVEGAEGEAAATEGQSGVVTLAADDSYQAIYDVLVLGSGCAGMSAAWEAAQTGARVGLIEARANYYEANSSVCAGMVWGWNTQQQKDNDVPEQTPEMCQTYLDACAGNGKPFQYINQIMIDEVDDNVQWLMDLGVELPAENLVAFGAEAIVADAVEPAPHTLVNAQKTGRGFTDVLYQACLDAGVEYVPNAKAYALITDPSGRVVGAATEKGNFRGNQGVIICTSGFGRNEMLTDSFTPNLSGSCAGPYSHGDGIIMGASVGARLTHMWCLQGPSVGTLMPGGIVLDNVMASIGKYDVQVGTDAKRHYNEDAYYETTYAYINELPDRMIWDILDQTALDLGPAELFAPPCSEGFEAEIEAGYVFRDDTIEGLAEQIGLDPVTLKETIDHYNEMMEKGVDEDFGRTQYLAPLNRPPYLAMKGIGATSDTAGGLVINENGQVLNWDNEPIPGLYAAGSTTGGWRGDNYPGCGWAIAYACIFGRHAGAHAAASDPSEYEGALAADAGSYLESEEIDVELADNEYVGVGQGMGGDVVVKIAVDGDTITAVEIVEQNETEGVGSRAVESLPQVILDAQTYDVDSVTGATVSSTAIRNAVQACMEEAGLL